MFLQILLPNFAIHQEEYLWLFLVFFNAEKRLVLLRPPRHAPHEISTAGRG